MAKKGDTARNRSDKSLSWYRVRYSNAASLMDMLLLLSEARQDVQRELIAIRWRGDNDPPTLSLGVPNSVLGELKRMAGSASFFISTHDSPPDPLEGSNLIPVDELTFSESCDVYLKAGRAWKIEDADDGEFDFSTTDGSPVLILPDPVIGVAAHPDWVSSDPVESAGLWPVGYDDNQELVYVNGGVILGGRIPLLKFVNHVVSHKLQKSAPRTVIIDGAGDLSNDILRTPYVARLLAAELGVRIRPYLSGSYSVSPTVDTPKRQERLELWLRGAGVFSEGAKKVSEIETTDWTTWRRQMYQMQSDSHVRQAYLATNLFATHRNIGPWLKQKGQDWLKMIEKRFVLVSMKSPTQSAAPAYHDMARHFALLAAETGCSLLLHRVKLTQLEFNEILEISDPSTSIMFSGYYLPNIEGATIVAAPSNRGRAIVTAPLLSNVPHAVEHVQGLGELDSIVANGEKSSKLTWDDNSDFSEEF